MSGLLTVVQLVKNIIKDQALSLPLLDFSSWLPHGHKMAAATPDIMSPFKTEREIGYTSNRSLAPVPFI